MNPYQLLKIKFLIFIAVVVGVTQLFPQEIKIDEIKFSGNRKVSAGKIRNAIKTKTAPWYNFFLFWKNPRFFKEEVFLNDLLRIEQFYHLEGFLEARIIDYSLNYNNERDAVKIKINIMEGEPTLVDSLDFSPVDSDTIYLRPEKLLKLISLKPGKRYRQENLRFDYNQLIEKYSNSGFPYIEAKVKPVIDRQSHRIGLTWFLNPGPFSKFGEINISGNSSVSDKLIRRGIDFKKGHAFEQKKLAIAQSQIYQLELFQYVNLQTTHLEDRPSEIPIQVQVKERKLRTLNFGVGYATEEEFRVKADWTNRNFFGGARILRTKAKHSTKILPLSLEMELNQPFFLDDQNDITLRTFFNWEDEESYEVQRIGFATIFNRQMSKHNNWFFTSRTERDSVRTKGDVSAEVLNDIYNKSVLSVGAKHNSTNQLFTPSKGMIAKIVLEESGFLFNSRFEYYKATAEYRIYHEIDNNNILATRIFLGVMNPYGSSETTPIEERFFSGGSYSVRGWERQELGPHSINKTTQKRTPRGGNSKLEGNLELRYSIYKEFGGILFLDYGNVWRKWNGFNFDDLKYALGMGLAYNTPIGPIRIDFAWKLNKQFPDESDYELHLNIGHSF